MSVNTVLESLYHAVSVVVALWGVGYGMWKDHKAKDDEGRKEKDWLPLVPFSKEPAPPAIPKRDDRGTGFAGVFIIASSPLIATAPIPQDGTLGGKSLATCYAVLASKTSAVSLSEA